MLRIALKCRASDTSPKTRMRAHTIFATTLPWGLKSPDVSDADCRCVFKKKRHTRPSRAVPTLFYFRRNIKERVLCG